MPVGYGEFESRMEGFGNGAWGMAFGGDTTKARSGSAAIADVLAQLARDPEINYANFLKMEVPSSLDGGDPNNAGAVTGGAGPAFYYGNAQTREGDLSAIFTTPAVNGVVTDYLLTTPAIPMETFRHIWTRMSIYFADTNIQVCSLRAYGLQADGSWAGFFGISADPTLAGQWQDVGTVSRSVLAYKFVKLKVFIRTLAAAPSTLYISSIRMGYGPRFNSGPAFPDATGKKRVLGDLFHRTDRNVLYVFDGTRWLSLNEYCFAMGPYAQFPGAVTTTSTILSAVVPYDFGDGVYLDTVRCFTSNAAVNDGANFRTYTLKNDAGTTIGSFDTHLDTAGVTTQHDITVQAVRTRATDKYWYLQPSVTGAPGTGSVFGATVHCRLVG